MESHIFIMKGSSGLYGTEASLSTSRGKLVIPIFIKRLEKMLLSRQKYCKEKETRESDEKLKWKQYKWNS